MLFLYAMYMYPHIQVVVTTRATVAPRVISRPLPCEEATPLVDLLVGSIVLSSEVGMQAEFVDG